MNYGSSHDQLKLSSILIRAQFYLGKYKIVVDCMDRIFGLAPKNFSILDSVDSNLGPPDQPNMELWSGVEVGAEKILGWNGALCK